MVIATALGWGNAASITISVVLAFFFGYLLTLGPILRAGVPFRRAAGLTVASDSISIATMELVDNAFILVVPQLGSGLSTPSRSRGVSSWSSGGSLRFRSTSSSRSSSEAAGLRGPGPTT